MQQLYIWAANQKWEAIAMFVPQLYCIICQRNHAAIFKAQIMAEKTTTSFWILNLLS